MAITGKPGGIARLHSWLDPRLIRFLLVGLLNLAFGYSTFALLLSIGLHYALASLLANVAGVLFNFKTTGRLVFGSRDNSLIGKFFGVYILVYLMGVVGLRLAKAAGLDLYLAGAVLTVVFAVVSFLLFRRFVFKGPPQFNPGPGA